MIKLSLPLNDLILKPVAFTLKLTSPKSGGFIRCFYRLKYEVQGYPNADGIAELITENQARSPTFELVLRKLGVESYFSYGGEEVPRVPDRYRKDLGESVLLRNKRLFEDLFQTKKSVERVPEEVDRYYTKEFDPSLLESLEGFAREARLFYNSLKAEKGEEFSHPKRRIFDLTPAESFSSPNFGYARREDLTLHFRLDAIVYFSFSHLDLLAFILDQIESRGELYEEIKAGFRTTRDKYTIESSLEGFLDGKENSSPWLQKVPPIRMEPICLIASLEAYLDSLFVQEPADGGGVAREVKAQIHSAYPILIVNRNSQKASGLVVEERASVDRSLDRNREELINSDLSNHETLVRSWQTMTRRRLMYEESPRRVDVCVRNKLVNLYFPNNDEWLKTFYTEEALEGLGPAIRFLIEPCLSGFDHKEYDFSWVPFNLGEEGSLFFSGGKNYQVYHEEEPRSRVDVKRTFSFTFNLTETFGVEENS